MKMRRIMLLLLVIAALPVLAKAQSLVDSGESSSRTVDLSVSTTTPLPDLTYMRPPQTTKVRNYFFDAFGPYPIVGAGLAAGINQADKTPPEWGQGAKGYSKRFSSDFGIAAVTTTTRYALSEAFHQDTLYYRCECKGVFRRLSHAVISTFTAPGATMAIASFLFLMWWLRMPAPLRPSMAGIPAATITRMVSEWATTAYWGM